ncbi:hypothetical protein D3C76_1389920 [compost metagenome]
MAKLRRTPQRRIETDIVAMDEQQTFVNCGGLAELIQIGLGARIPGFQVIQSRAVNDDMLVGISFRSARPQHWTLKFPFSVNVRNGHLRNAIRDNVITTEPTKLHAFR